MDPPWKGVRRVLGFDVVLKFGDEVFIAGDAFFEDDIRFEDFAPEFVGGSDDTALEDGRVGGQDAFHIKRPNAVSGHDDEVIVPG